MAMCSAHLRTRCVHVCPPGRRSGTRDRKDHFNVSGWKPDGCPVGPAGVHHHVPDKAPAAGGWASLPQIKSHLGSSHLCPWTGWRPPMPCTLRPAALVGTPDLMECFPRAPLDHQLGWPTPAAPCPRSALPHCGKLGAEPLRGRSWCGATASEASVHGCGSTASG